ncbi:hypothetical protein CR513_18494, partial [Mucuna pruriens]
MSFLSSFTIPLLRFGVKLERTLVSVNAQMLRPSISSPKIASFLHILQIKRQSSTTHSHFLDLYLFLFPQPLRLCTPASSVQGFLVFPMKSAGGDSNKAESVSTPHWSSSSGSVNPIPSRKGLGFDELVEQSGPGLNSRAVGSALMVLFLGWLRKETVLF